MMNVIFRKEAEGDLRDVVEWYEQTAPEVIGAILADIYRAIDQLIDFPLSGPKVPGQAIRRIVTRKYRFKIAYHITDRTIAIVGIYRYQNRDR